MIKVPALTSAASGNPGFNQSPPTFDKSLTTRSSLICGAGRIQGEEYNLGLHVMALFLVLAQSSLGTSLNPLPQERD